MKLIPLAATALLAVLVAAASASAATLSGTIPGGKGLQIVVVQSSGKGKKATITKGNGSFKLAGVKLAGSSVQLVDDDGTYLGPIVLGGAKTKVYATIKGAASLSLGTVKLKNGYGVTTGVASTRMMTTAPYTVTAKGGRPIGAGKVGRVKVGNGRSALKGYDGPGYDTDLDGLPGVFDVDDNGNLILDNVDRTTRTGLLLRGAFARQAICPAPPAAPTPGCITPAPDGGGAVPAATEFRLFSNFKLTGNASINLYLGGTTAAVQPLINAAFPSTLTLATQIVGASSATLDCLGNVYCASHVTAGVTYPLVNGAPATFAGTALGISTGPTGDAQITPGAATSEIGSGNAFIENAGGAAYPGLLNFTFTTAPAVYSYQTSASATEQVIAYDPVTGWATGSIGMTPSTPIIVGADGAITLKWWRPQRPIMAGEASPSGWIDIGGLQYTADAPNAPRSATGVAIGTPPGNCPVTTYTNAVSNGVAFTNTGASGVQDPALDAATNPAAAAANLLQFTVDARTCFGTATWDTLTTGATFDFDIQARSLYGDNAARKLYFKRG
jgi:hypothetical protein